MTDGGSDNGQQEETIVYQSDPDDSDETKLSTHILLALDSLPGYDVESSETVVFDHVDLDALDELFTHVDGTSRQGKVIFPIGDYQVTATAAGEVTIREHAAAIDTQA